MNIGDVGDDARSQSSQAHCSGETGLRQEVAQSDITTEKILDILSDLREKDQLCDAVLRVEDVLFPVHRNIMSVSSAFFRALFTNKGFQPQRGSLHEPQAVNLTDVSPEVVGFLVDYAYSRQVLITEENVQTIFHAADRFLMPDLVKTCCEFLKDKLCAENCLGIAAFARAYFRPGLEKAAMLFAFRHFNNVVAQSTEYLELGADALHDFLCSDLLNVRHEEAVFEAICKWIMVNPEERGKEMAHLLGTVRLGFLSTQYLMERIKVNEFVRADDSAKAIVLDAIKCVCKLETKDGSGIEDVSSITKPRVPHEILFVVGGWSGGSPIDIIETYDTRADRWLVCRPPDSEPRAYHACVAVGQTIYVVGGFNGVEYFNSCRKFCPVNLCWTEAPPMNSKRCYVSAAVLEDMVYAMGGFDGHVRLNTVERFDPSTNQWSYVLPMIQQRSDAKASVLNEKIYICGGFNGQECLNTAEYYDRASNQWTMITPMRNRRSGVGVVAYLGCLYALGGFNGITRMNTGERYNPETRLWSSIPEMFSPRSNFAVGVIDDLLFTIGGFNGVTTISQVECFDAALNEWFDASGLSLFRSALSACVVKDIPNVMDFVFKPRTSTMRKRPVRSHPANESSDNDTGSPSRRQHGEESPPVHAQGADDNLLNQLS